jgi:O-antigen/teichoic acid export membrane protein
MKSSQRIALNAMASFSRTILGAGLLLFSSRWVFNGLGQIDFGIYSIVGSLIIFVVFFNTVMSTSASRHFAFAIGQGDMREVNRWFNAALSIHLVLAVVLVLAGWMVGEYWIMHWLTIPVERVLVSAWVFRISLVSAFFGMASVPFIAMFTAQQRITELAIFGVIQSFCCFIWAWWISQATGDRLLLYAIGMSAIPTSLYIVQIFRALSVFEECAINKYYFFDAKRLREITSFAVWNLIGSLGALLRNQGTAILLNIYFGAKINASYGIANQVSAQTNQVAAAMMGAFTPEITASEGRGNREGMLSLALRVCKIGTISILFITIPLMVELEYILKLWLIDPPEHTALFCRLILTNFLIDWTTSGYMMAVNAYGRIAAYQATLGTILVMTLPIAWVFLYIGLEPTSVGIAFIITMALCSIGRILWVKHLFGVPLQRWISRVLVPCVFVGIIILIGAIFPFLMVPESFCRLVLTTVTSTVMGVVITWYVGLDDTERVFFKRSIMNIMKKMKLRVIDDNSVR